MGNNVQRRWTCAGAHLLGVQVAVLYTASDEGREGHPQGLPRHVATNSASSSGEPHWGVGGVGGGGKGRGAADCNVNVIVHAFI